MSRPLIGLTVYDRLVTTNRVGEMHVTANPVSFARLIDAAGGVPIFIPNVALETLRPVLDQLDGIVLTGGGDVDARRYGEDPRPETFDVDETRDGLENYLSLRAVQEGVPMLGTCRGMQILNVVLGGTLVQEIGQPRGATEEIDHNPKAELWEATHWVTVEPGSRLASVHGPGLLKVNSFHHQVVSRLGEGLRATAVSPDGLIEAVEAEDPEVWIVGVQWHPELMSLRYQHHAGLFNALVDAASATRRLRERIS